MVAEFALSFEVLDFFEKLDVFLLLVPNASLEAFDVQLVVVNGFALGAQLLLVVLPSLVDGTFQQLRALAQLLDAQLQTVEVSVALLAQSDLFLVHPDYAVPDVS